MNRADRMAVLPQYLLPKMALTRAAGRVARWQGGSATQALIRRFIARYQVDMSEAADPDPAAYDSFNAFFTRPLRAGARPLAESAFLCPVDGAISQLGAIERDRILQAKGHGYSTTALLGGDAALAAPFENGAFATLYLSPRDYHRIHMPCAGRLRRMIHVPGDLFSVNPTTARGVPGLFARNERVVCLFDHVGDDDGAGAGTGDRNSRIGEDDANGRSQRASAEPRPFALVLVGATIVGSMATVWHGVVNAARPGTIRQWRYDGADAPVLPRGAEMGRFLLGSTVVLLFTPDTLRFAPDWAAGRPVRMGEAMGQAMGEAIGGMMGDASRSGTARAGG